MSVLGLKSGYTLKYGLSPRDCPQAVPLGNPSGSGHILPYILPLVLIRIQYHQVHYSRVPNGYQVLNSMYCLYLYRAVSSGTLQQSS